MAWGVPKIGSNVIDATGNFDLIEPAGVAEGDLMVACIAMRGNAVVTAPAGWSIAATQQNSGDTDTTDGIASAAMFYIIRGSSAPSLTCTRTAGDVAYAKVISYSGAHSSPLDVSSSATQGSAGATPTTAGFTTTEDGELIVAFAAFGDQYTASAFDAATDPTTASGATDTTTVPTNGTWIERFDANTNTGADTGIAIADAVKQTAGATGTIQATISSASGRNVLMAAAFKNSRPSLSLSSPSDGATISDSTPALEFTGTDTGGDSVRYHVKVNTGLIVDTGSYIGNGTDGRSVSVGFQPDLVIVKATSSTTPADVVFKTSDMAGNVSLPLRNDFASGTDIIKTLTSNGFTVGTSVFANQSGVTYTYTAFKQNGSTDFAVFTYTGDASDGKAITGLGFQPDYVCIKSDSAITGAHKFTGTTDTQMFFSGTDRSDLIVSLDSNGFTVNNGSASGANLVNVNATAHYGFAFKQNSRIDVLQYTGNSTDNTDVATSCTPDFVIVKGNTAQNAMIRTSDFTGDASSPFDGGPIADAIQSFATNKFVVGTHASVNSSTVTYSALVINSDAALEKISGTDSGFANTTDGGDTDPFDSGDLASFTVQGGDALSDGTYYWRVRGTDPSGSNLYGDWATQRSFTLNTSATVKDLIGTGIIPFARS